MPDWLSRYAERPAPASAPAGDWLSAYADAEPPEQGLWDKAFSWGTTGLATPAVQRVGQTLTNPTLDRGVGESQLRGFLAGALEGASNAFTSPLGIASTLLGGLPGVGAIKALPASARAIGGGLAGVAEYLNLPGLARTVSLANASMGVPSLVHGGGEVLEGAQSGDLRQIGQGAIETGMGALGAAAPFIHPGAPAAPRQLRPSGTPPPVKLGLPAPYDATAHTPSNDLARKAAYLARTGRTVPAQGAMPPPAARMNAPLREGDTAGLLAFLNGPEPLDVTSIGPSVPLQDWTPPPAVVPGPDPFVAAGAHMQDWNPTPGQASYNPNRMNAPLREGDLEGLLASLMGPEPLDPRSVSPSVPLQDWTPSGADVGVNPRRMNEPAPRGVEFDMLPGRSVPLQDWNPSGADIGVNPRRMNEPPPQASAAQLLDEHVFPNGRRTVPEQSVLPAAPWLEPDMAGPGPRPSPLSALEDLLAPSAGPASVSRAAHQPPLPGALEPGTNVGAFENQPWEQWAATDRAANARFVEAFMRSLGEPVPPEHPRFRPEPPVAGDVVTPPVPPADLGLPAPSAERSDPDVIARLFAYGPSRTLESLNTPGAEPFISPEITELLAGQPGGLTRPDADLLDAAREAAQRWAAPNERDLPWRERLAMRSNEERFQHAINEPDRPASLSALESVGSSRPEVFDDPMIRINAERAARERELDASVAALPMPKRFADASPEEQRELRRLLDEMQSFPFTKRTFNETVGQGGSLDVVAGAGGAPVFHDIMGGRSGSRGAVIRALQSFIEGGKAPTAITKRAIEVARRELLGDSRLSRRLVPTEEQVPSRANRQELSEADWLRQEFRDTDFPFGANDPTGEAGFISTDPAQWKQVAKKAGKSLEALRFFSMLSGPLTHAKNIAGNLGAVTLESARRGMRGDLSGAGRILGETFSPEWVRDLRAGFNHPESSAWGPESIDRPKTGVLSWPSRAAEAPDYATRQALRRAGLTDEEARHVTYTGEPRSQAGQAFVGGVRKAGTIGRLISPFPRIATNLLEVGLEHTPLLGSIAQSISDGRLKSGWDKQSLGALAALAGATFGGFSNPYAQAIFQAALGPVNLPYAAGTAVAKGLDEGDSLPDIGKAIWSRYAEGSPIPQYLATPADMLAQHVPTIFQQLGMTDPKAVSAEAGDLWPFGKAISKLPGGDRLLSAPTAPRSSWLEQYGDR